MFLKISLKKFVGLQYIGIPFVSTNYFCGNKSVFAVLNSHQRTVNCMTKLFILLPNNLNKEPVSGLFTLRTRCFYF